MVRPVANVRTDSQGMPQPPAGSDVRSVAKQVEGLLDDDGHFNPNPDQLSRGHPDYDESTDERAHSKERDERGRFKKAADSAQADDTGRQRDRVDDEDDDDYDADAAGDDRTEDTEDGDTNDDQATSADDETQTDDQDTGELKTLADFAEALEVPIDTLKESLTHTFTAAGEEVTVTLAELEKGYQKDADYRRSTARLAEDRRQAEQDFRTRFQSYEQQNHLLAAQLQTAEQLVAAELEDPRMMELRSSDPSEWTARREEIGERLSKLRNARAHAAQAYQNFVYQNLTQLRQREMAALQQAVPDFGAEHKAKVKKALTDFGYTDQEIAEVFDHRLITGVLELVDLRSQVAELKKLKDDADVAVKRLRKDVPKLQKPGKSTTQTQKGLKRDNVRRLRDRARKSGRLDDAAKVIEQMI